MEVEQTNETVDTILTDETVETGEKEVSTEDALYNNDQQSDETADETKEETEDSESESEVTESKEETESDETEETTEDETKEVEYNLKLEEGSLIAESMLEDIESFARENELSIDAANNLMKTQENLLKGWVEAKTGEIEAEKDAWRDQIINDKVLGGDNLKVTVANSKKAVERFASPEFVNLLRSTGYGDHPEVVKFFSKVGSLLNSDVLVNGNEFGGPKTTEELFYGNN